MNKFDRDDGVSRRKLLECVTLSNTMFVFARRSKLFRGDLSNVGFELRIDFAGLLPA
jgi:hypothetical protein